MPAYELSVIEKTHKPPRTDWPDEQSGRTTRYNVFRTTVREEWFLSSTHCHRITGAQQRSNGYSVKSRRQCQKLSEQPVTLSYDQYVFRPCDFNSSFGVDDFNSTNVQISIDNSPKSQYTYKVSVFRYNYNNINLRLWWNWQTR